MQGSMMHCGAEPIPMLQLIELPIPDHTDTHFPIPHHQMFDLAQERLLGHGYQITNPEHYITKDSSRYFALMQIRHEEEDQNEEHSTMCALRNSHDKSFSASLAVGARVFVCDNLSFSGDIVVGRKHTANLRQELPDIFESAIAKIRVMRKRQDVRFAEYKKAPLDDYTADHLIMECFRRSIINLQRINRVNQEWYKPTADHGDKSVWRYFNAATAALSPTSTNQLIQLSKKTIDLHLLLDDFCDVEFTDLDTPKSPSIIDRFKSMVN